MAGSAEVDNAKAIAMPILFITAMIIAVFITRKTLAAAYQASRCCCGEADFRVGILFWGGITSALLSVFLFPTGAWGYGVTCCLFAYCFSMSVGSVEKHANRLFVATAIFFATMLGLPSRWSSGMIAKLSTGCKQWFTSSEKQGDYCKESWTSFTIVVGVSVIICFFFILLTLLSFAFDVATQGKVMSAKAQSMQQPLNNGEMEDNRGSAAAAASSGGGAPSAMSQ